MFVFFPYFFPPFPPKKVVFNVEKHRPFYHGKNKNHLGWWQNINKNDDVTADVTYICDLPPHARQEYGKDALFDSLFPDLKQFKDWHQKCTKKWNSKHWKKWSETLILLGWLWQPRSLVGHLAHVGLLATSYWRRGWDSDGTQVLPLVLWFKVVMTGRPVMLKLKCQVHFFQVHEKTFDILRARPFPAILTKVWRPCSSMECLFQGSHMWWRGIAL